MWPWQVPHRGSDENGANYFGRSRPFGWFSAHAGGWELEASFGAPVHAASAACTILWSSYFVDTTLALHQCRGQQVYVVSLAHRPAGARIIGVTESKEGIRSAPDGTFQPCPAARGMYNGACRGRNFANPNGAVPLEHCACGRYRADSIWAE